MVSFFLKKMGHPRRLFSFIFVFSNKHHHNSYNKYMWKNDMPIQHQESNPQPSKHESPPITTRPGLPPNMVSFLYSK